MNYLILIKNKKVYLIFIGHQEENRKQIKLRHQTFFLNIKSIMLIILKDLMHY